MLSPPMLEGVRGGVFCDPSNWTLDSEWDTREGDMSNIDSHYGSGLDCQGFGWSPDGTYLTIACAVDASIKTFTCSTAFDPDTASSSPTGTISISNDGWFRWISGGTRWFHINVVGDVIQEYNSSGTAYVVASGSLQHDLNKNEVSIGGTSDQPFAPDPSGTFLYWLGQNSASPFQFRLVYVPLSPDLDNPGTESILNNPSVTSVEDFTVTNNAGTHWLSVALSGARLWQVDSEGDVSSLSIGSEVDIETQFTYTWSPSTIWIDPNDPSSVWVAGRQGGSGEMQMAKFSTNC